MYIILYDHMNMENFIGFRKIELLSIFYSINIFAHFTNQINTFFFIAVILSIFMHLNCTCNLVQDTFSIFQLPTIIFIDKIYLYIKKFSIHVYWEKLKNKLIIRESLHIFHFYLIFIQFTLFEKKHYYYYINFFFQSYF